MKIASIGVGYWGSKHVGEYNKLGIAPILCDMNENNIAYCEEKFKISGVKTFDEILADKSIDAVDICLPNEMHYDYAKRALESRKHIFLEKPMTIQYDDALDLVKIAKDYDKKLAVGHIYRFNNAIKAVKKKLNDGEFGEVYLAKLDWTNLEAPFERDIIFDLATHPFDIIYYLFNKFPNEISCVGEGYRVPGKEAIFITGKIDKKLMNFDLNYLSPERKRELMVTGEKMSMKVDCVTQDVKVLEHSDDIAYGRTRKVYASIFPVKTNNPLKDELGSFIASLQSKDESTNSGESCAEVVRMLEFSRKSADENRKIVIERD